MGNNESRIAAAAEARRRSESPRKSRRVATVSISGPVLTGNGGADSVSAGALATGNESPASTPSLALPSKQDLEAGLELVMEDLGMSEDQKHLMRLMPDERKWTLIQSHLRDKQGEIQIPELEQLQSNPSEEVVKNLLVMLRSRPISWITSFTNAGGLRHLISMLEELEVNRHHDVMEELLIRCIRAIMNNKPGLAAVLESVDNLLVISLALRSANLRVKALVLEIFAALCFIPGGHRAVLEAMGQLKDALGHRYRFTVVVACLLMEPTATQVALVVNDLQVATMAFINAMICGGQGAHQLEARAHIRYELYSSGITEALERLSFSDRSHLDRHIEIFESTADHDEGELLARLESTTDLDKNSPSSVFSALQQSVVHSQVHRNLLSLLNHLVLLPAQPDRNRLYWMFIDALVQQIVLQKTGTNPDPLAVVVPSLDVAEAMARLEAMKPDSDETIKRVETMQAELVALKEQLAKETERAEANRIKAEKAEADRIKDAEKAAAELAADLPHRPRRARIRRSTSTPTPTTAQLRRPPPPPPPPPGFGGPPPPPPPPGMGGPPPPPPPPGGFRGPPPPPPPGGGPPPPPGGPPPPPGGGFRPVAAPAAKKTNLSSKPLRGLNWSKLPPPAAAATVFKGMNETEIHATMDTKAFEDLFAAAAAGGKKAAADTTESNGNLATATPAKVQLISVVDAKRAQNCNILLKKIKLEIDEIKRAVVQGDTAALPADVVLEMLKYVPAEDEVAALNAATDEPTKLATADRFLFEASRIEKYQERLGAMVFRSAANEVLGDFKSTVTTLRDASVQVVESKAFKEVLKIVLALGNYMNAGARGGAFGFKVEALLKLGDVKSNQNVNGRKHTLIHFLVELIDAKFPAAQPFADELSSVDAASKLSLPIVRAAQGSLRVELRRVKTLVDTLKKPEDKEFVESMAAFYDKTAAEFDSYEQIAKDADAKFEAAATAFAEDPKVVTAEEFFGTFAKFVAMYRAAAAENVAWVQKQAEIEKKEADRKRKEEEAAAKKRSKSPEVHAPESADPTSPELDALIDHVKSGRAFQVKGPATPGGKQRGSGASGGTMSLEASARSTVGGALQVPLAGGEGDRRSIVNRVRGKSQGRMTDLDEAILKQLNARA
ncbi:hypothetical protein AMAG_18842 [Allomyces macrogynus ATCC 38327]|uniref:FH2 domain-containing protein n=1 Tax=Allomyces macrogynus (strain ATCC 38327) TaxID=578462 RepID=A0A0L0SIJ4_ALLM3|nr:hypothetical protein AMAG_18842 [Allomyces macrogynus ATCC 38327]|eukprot:KNE62292.1 hypothetical protein AMAG_18842 [Allomyces macrogynus ATCC 38327]